MIAFAFDPIHRYQTESDFRLVWNAILHWNDLPPTPAALASSRVLGAGVSGRRGHLDGPPAGAPGCGTIRRPTFIPAGPVQPFVQGAEP